MTAYTTGPHASRVAAMVASNKELHESVKKPQSYILEDEEGNYYLVDEGTSYAERLRKFDSPTYTFYVDYGVGALPLVQSMVGSLQIPLFRLSLSLVVLRVE